METKTERFEMRLDQSTVKRLDAWRQQQPALPSRAEAVRRLIDTELSDVDNSRPPKFSDGEKLITILLCKILQHLKVDSPIDPGFIENALYSGHHWALERQYPGIFDTSPVSNVTVQEVMDVLELWQFLEQSYANLPEGNRTQLEEKASVSRHDVEFPGFDGNHETEHFAVATFLTTKLGLFAQLQHRDLNSHMPVLAGYRRMLRAFSSIKQGLRMGDFLTPDQIIELLKAER